MVFRKIYDLDYRRSRSLFVCVSCNTQLIHAEFMLCCYSCMQLGEFDWRMTRDGLLAIAWKDVGNCKGMFDTRPPLYTHDTRHNCMHCV